MKRACSSGVHIMRRRVPPRRPPREPPSSALDASPSSSTSVAGAGSDSARRRRLPARLTDENLPHANQTSGKVPPSKWRIVWRKMAHGHLNGSMLSYVACNAENDQHLPFNSSPSVYIYRHIGADSAQPAGTARTHLWCVQSRDHDCRRPPPARPR